jgi:hypothetical protein
MLTRIKKFYNEHVEGCQAALVVVGGTTAIFATIYSVYKTEHNKGVDGVDLYTDTNGTHRINVFLNDGTARVFHTLPKEEV